MLGVFKGRDRTVVAPTCYLSGNFFFQSVTNPAILGLSVNGFCLWNQGVFLLGYVLLGYDKFSLGGTRSSTMCDYDTWRVSLTLCSETLQTIVFRTMSLCTDLPRL